MDSVKKIAILKSDEPAAVAEKVMDAAAETVILSIPKFSKFAQSATNFRLIKRQADVLQKTVKIESVDDEVVSLAKEQGLEAVNPFLARTAKTQKRFSDIVVSPKPSRKKVAPAAEPIQPRVIAPVEPAVPEIAAPAPTVIPAEEAFAPPTAPVRTTKTFSVDKLPSGRRLIGSLLRVRTAVLLAIGLFLFGVVPYVALAVLPRAEIDILTTKEPWSFKNAVVVDKAITTTDLALGRVPGQVFIQKTNASTKYPANGVKQIQKKATGSIVIYNGFSSSPQSLVASTRFEAADGKIYRLNAGVTVPGAKIEDGKIVASSITASVTADKAGEGYNSGPVERLSIPGFSGTPKYAAFYAKAGDGFKGGYVGEAKVATDADIKTAKAQASASLEASLKTLLATQMPTNFKVVEGASAFTIIKQTVTPEADVDGQFSVLTEGQLLITAFLEKDVLAFLHDRIKRDKGEVYQVDGEQITYGAARMDGAAGKLSFAVTYSAQLSRTVDQAALLAEIMGDSEEELRATIAALPGVERANVSLWPFYVRTVPKSIDRIRVSVQ